MKDRPLHDVIVLGGGPGGAAAALVLARRRVDVVLLESSADAVFADAVFKVGESLPPTSHGLLQRLELLPLLNSGGHLRCYGNQSSWGSPALTDTDFLFTPPGYGWHLDRGAFERGLRRLVEEAGGVVRSRVHVRELRRTAVGHEAISGGERWSARLLIDATGLVRFFLRHQGVECQRHDRLIATIALFAAGAETRDEDSRTLIEATPDGWWHSALVPGGRRVVMEFTDAEDLGPRSSESFARRLRETRYVAERLFDQGYQPVGEPQRKPVESALAQRVVGADWLAVGDAAMAVDPLSSRGISNALSGAEAAAEALCQHLAGDDSALGRYQAGVEKAFAEYLDQRAYFYAMEKRWSARPFWRRRQR